MSKGGNQSKNENKIKKRRNKNKNFNSDSQSDNPEENFIQFKRKNKKIYGNNICR